MDAQELQQRPCATLLHPDDDGLRKLLAAEVIGYRDVVRRSVAVREVRQLLPDERHLRRVVRAGLPRRRLMSITHRDLVVVITLLVVNWPGQRVTVSVEAVEEVREENDHGKEDGQLGLHPQVSKVERSSPFTTSHESQSWARGHNAGNMSYQRTSCHRLRKNKQTNKKKWSQAESAPGKPPSSVRKSKWRRGRPPRVTALHMLLGSSHAAPRSLSLGPSDASQAALKVSRWGGCVRVPAARSVPPVRSSGSVSAGKPSAVSPARVAAKSTPRLSSDTPPPPGSPRHSETT